MKKRLRLNALVAGILSVVMVALMLALSAVTFRIFQSNLQNSMYSTLDSMVKNNAQAAGDLIHRVESCFDLFPDENRETLDALLYEDSDMYRTLPYYNRVRSKLEQNLRTLVGGRIANSIVLLIVDDSMPLSQICTALTPNDVFEWTEYAIPYALMSKSDLLRGEDFYAEAIKANGKTCWFTYPGNENMLYAARAIRQMRQEYNRITNYSMGVMLIGFDARWIRAQLMGKDMMQDAAVYITSGDNIVYTSDAANAQMQMSDLVQKGDAPAGMAYYQGALSYSWNTALNGDLSLVTLMSKSRISQLVYQSLRLVVVEMAVILLVTLAVIALLIRKLLQPITLLSGHMKANVLQTIPVPALACRTEEMYALFNSFNECIQRISQLMNEVRANEEEKHRQEMRLLQAQVNPHFIYNTLDSISCMALLQGNEAIADLLGDLANILRYNLKNPDSEVPLSQEIDTVNSYLALQRVRCAEGLNVQMTLSEESLACLLPKMSVQPLVENAVVHVSGRPSLRLESRVEADRLIIVVSNLSQDADIEKITAHLAGNISIPTRSTGLGIRNVAQRIRLAYGDGFGLHYEREGEWLKAVLVLPRRTNDGAL